MDLPPLLYLWKFCVLCKCVRYELLFFCKCQHSGNVTPFFFALATFSYWLSSLITLQTCDKRRVFEQSITLTAREVNLKTISGKGNTKGLMGEAVKKKRKTSSLPFSPMAEQDAKIENFHFKTLLYSWRAKVPGIGVDGTLNSADTQFVLSGWETRDAFHYRKWLSRALVREPWWMSYA